MICQRRRSSRPPSNKDLAALVLPECLNRISPFLQEAQSCFRDDSKADSKIVVYCIDHAVCYIHSPYLSSYTDSLCRHVSSSSVLLWFLEFLAVSLI